MGDGCNMKKIALFIMSALLLAGCGGSDSGGGKTPIPVDVTGEWELTDITVKSALVGDQTADVYLKFQAGEFTIYQKIGEGRPKVFTGTYSLTENLLSGKYSDGKSWGASYDVEIEGSVMRLTTHGGKETDTYRKSSIPSDWK